MKSFNIKSFYKKHIHYNKFELIDGHIITEFWIMFFNCKIDVIKVSKYFKNSIIDGIKHIYYIIKYILYAKKENRKIIKEYNEAVNKLNNKQIMFE